MKELLKKRLFKVFIFVLVIGSFTGYLFWSHINFETESSPIFLDRNGDILFSQITDQGFRYPQKLSNIPSFLPQLLISAEDENFYSHPGVDIRGIARAIYLNLKERKIVSGGSTITQQAAHNILFEERTGGKTLYEKTVESVFALVLDSFWSKDKILEEYFNRMYFGRLAYGIETASRHYFNKPSSQLDLAEGSALLALLHLPSTSDPGNNMDLLKSRQQYILNRGVDTNVITRNEADLAYQESLHFIDFPNENLLSQCLQQYLTNEARKMLNLQASDSVDLSNLTIKTTLDVSFLQESDRVLTEKLNEIAADYEVNNTAAIAIDPTTGEILSYNCNVSYSEKDKHVDLIQALRQPGSAIKPVTYLNALSQGFTLSSPLNDRLQTFYTHDGKPFVPEDYDQRERGLVTVREALASSLNIPAVELLEKTGLESFFSTAKVLGIRSFADTHRYDLAITLGGGEVSLNELTSVYATIANELNRIEPYVISKIERANTTIYTHETVQQDNVMGRNSRELSYLISDVLSDNNARRFAFPEINPLVTSRKTAVKTGTTQDFRDSWTLGYTPKITVGVWVGNADQTPMLGLSGAQGAAPIWHDLMEIYLKNGYSSWFQKPNGVYYQDVCLNPTCDDLKAELFLEGTEHEDYALLNQESKVNSEKTIKITYPYAEQIFQINTEDDLSEFQKIIFKAEVSAVSTGTAAKWILNQHFLGSSEISNGSLRFIWSPQPGTYELEIEDWQGNSDMIRFKVIEKM